MKLTDLALLLFILAAFALVGRIDLEVAEAEAHPSSLSPHPSTKITLDLRDCTPPGVKVSPIISFTLTRIADDRDPTVLGCTRYAATNIIPTNRILSERSALP